MTLDSLGLFLRIIEKGGLASAGRELGMSPASVSERLAALEEHYGITLLKRTTRAISLTNEGRLLAEGARRLLAESRELDSRVRLGVDRMSGPIRLSAPEDLGRQHIVPILHRFLEAHPDVTLDLNLTDGLVDMVAQGLDFVIRFGLLTDRSLRFVSLGENRRIVCAAPSYIARRGAPQHPEDLTEHDCIVLRLGQNLDHEWPFMINGRLARVRIRGRRIVNDGGLVKDWCLAGHGVAMKSLTNIDRDLENGSLVEVLRPYSSGPTALNIVYAPSAVQPHRVRLLMDWIVADFARAPYDPDTKIDS